MADSEPSKRPSPGTKAQNLLNRFPVTDLATAVSLRGDARQMFLREFVRTSPARNYVPTRQSYHMIYGACPPLFDIPPEPWAEIDKNVRSLAEPFILDMNIAASRELFNLVRPMNYRATGCDEQVFRAGHNQIVPINLTFYVTKGDRLIFQFPQLRLDYPSDEAIRILGSVVFHAYAQGDYAEAEIEIAEVGRKATEPPRSKIREGRIRAVPRDQILDRVQLGAQIDDVYSILRELVGKPPHK